MKRIDELKDIIKGKKAAEAPKAPERELPEPGDMSMSLTEVLMRRRSSLDFPTHRSATKIWCASCGRLTA